MDDISNRKARAIQFSNGKVIRGHAAQAIDKVTLKEKLAKMNDLTGIAIFSFQYAGECI
jgi:mannitol-1-phosphate/altronate dehydrogenase